MEYKNIFYITMLLFGVSSARNKKRSGDRGHSILWICDNQSVIREECIFLRNHEELWSDLKDMKNQIRKLKTNANAVSPKDLIPIEEMRLKLIQLRIGVTRNSENEIILDQEVVALKSEDERFRSSLRFLKEVEIASLHQKINEVKTEIQDIKYYIMDLIKNETASLQEQIIYLNDENELLRNNQRTIQEISLTFIRDEIEKMKTERKEMQTYFEDMINKQEIVLSNKIENCNVNIHTTKGQLHIFQDKQGNINSNNNKMFSSLVNETQDLEENIATFKKHSQNITYHSNTQLSILATDIAEVNGTLNLWKNVNDMDHNINDNHITRIDQSIGQINTDIHEFTKQAHSEHDNIHNKLDNMTSDHLQLELNLNEYKTSQKLVINETKQEILNVWDGKEFVNKTLEHILDVQKQDQNITREITKMLQEENGKQDSNMKSLGSSLYKDTGDINTEIMRLKQRDADLETDQNNLWTRIKKQRNETQEHVVDLQHTDYLLNSSINTLVHKLSGPFLLFTSYPSRELITYKTGEKLVFDQITVNFGNHYKTENGSFICPVHGIYQGFVSVWSNQNQRGQIELMRDGSVIFKAASHPEPGSRQHGSNEASFECHKGQEVWIRGGTEGVLYTDNRQNSFSANLMHNLEYFPDDDFSNNT